jgi:hypothetical protein
MTLLSVNQQLSEIQKVQRTAHKYYPSKEMSTSSRNETAAPFEFGSQRFQTALTI